MVQQLNLKKSFPGAPMLMEKLHWFQFLQHPVARRLKKILFWVGFVIALFSSFFWGLQHSFPGATIADFVENQIHANTGITVKISPLQLGWKTLHIDSVEIMVPEQMNHPDISKLIEFQQIDGYLWPLLSQDIVVLSQAYNGKIRIDTDMRHFNQMNYSLSKIALDQIPVMNIIPYIFIRADLSMRGQITNLRALQNRKEMFAQGNVQGKLENMLIRLKDSVSELLPGMQLPDVQLDEVSFQIDYGNTMNIKELRIRGDIEGVLKGSIQWNPQNLMSSRVNIQARAKLGETLQKAAGSMAVLLRQFQCGETFDVELTGTLGQMNLPKRRRCT
ncbi:MAG: type II secretion system protein GspN [SAR324 cluster bacterium]|nr:type II secretion system protein GspN [SAR324 cluster bacterium]